MATRKGIITTSVIGEERIVALMVETTKRANDASPAFQRFARKFRGHIIQQFATEGSHFGTPWAPLNPRYAAFKMRKYGPLKILQREGTLRASLMRRAMSIMTITNNELVLGTDVPYASVHQEGRGNNPERPIIVATDEVKNDAREILSNYLRNAPDSVHVIGEI